MLNTLDEIISLSTAYKNGASVERAYIYDGDMVSINDPDLSWVPVQDYSVTEHGECCENFDFESYVYRVIGTRRELLTGTAFVRKYIECGGEEIVAIRHKDKVLAEYIVKLTGSDAHVSAEGIAIKTPFGDYLLPWDELHANWEIVHHDVCTDDPGEANYKPITFYA